MSLIRRIVAALAVVAVVGAIWGICHSSSPLRQFWQRCAEWHTTQEERSEICKYLDIELSILEREQATGWSQRAVDDCIARGKDPSLLHATLLGAAHGAEVCGAKRRALERGRVRKTTAMHVPLLDSGAALVCSSYGALGPIVFRIEKHDEDLAYHAIAALVAARQ